jgi:aspartyl-tRNA(Asn)/glutamyl-tRNA(Gln) amidotransferase subunit C
LTNLFSLEKKQVNLAALRTPETAFETYLESRFSVALSEKEVRHVARLAALEVNAEELPKMQKDLNEILAFVEKLQSVSSLGVEPTSHVHGATNFFRDDVIRDSFPVEEVEKNAPDFAANSFRVPRII